MPSSRGSSRPRDQTWVSRIAGRFFPIWATRGDLLSKHRINDSHYFLPLSVQPFMRILTLWWICGPRSLIWLLVSANCDDYTPPFPALYCLALCPGCWALHATFLHATSPKLPCSLCLPVGFSDGMHQQGAGVDEETAVRMFLPRCLTLGTIALLVAVIFMPAAPARWALFQDSGSPCVLVMFIPPSSGPSGPCCSNFRIPWHLLLTSLNLYLIPLSNSFQNPSFGAFHFLLGPQW